MVRSALFALLAVACATIAPPPPAAVFTAGAVATPAVAASSCAPPIARRERHVETIHGIERTDDYYWLRQKGAPEVIEYLAAENAYTETMTRSTFKLQDRLYGEMLARIKETDISVPYRDHDWFYYQRAVDKQQYPIYCRKRASGAQADDRTGATTSAPEQVVLDLNETGREHKFVELGASAISDDGSFFAFALDTTGFRQYELRVKDLRTDKLLPESFPRVDRVAWSADGKSFFYVSQDATTKRANRLYRHVLGTDPATDVLVYEERDEMFKLDLTRTRSRAYLVATSISKTTSEVRTVRADRPGDPWQVIEPRQHEVKYSVDHRGDRFFIVTDAPAVRGSAKARNFRLVSAPIASPGRAHWKEIVPHRDDVMLVGIELFADFTVLHERAGALPRLRILPPSGAPWEVPQSESVYALKRAQNAEFGTHVYRFICESPITPETVYDYDLRTHQATVLKRQEVLGGYDSSRYASERIYATASDGTSIPVSLVYRKDLPAGPRPTLLYGYGSYGMSIPLSFSSNRVSFLDRGGVWALAHVRGGGDLGTSWHDGARMATKMNTFTDFIACAEELIRKGRTAPDQLAIQGLSAGGLLMGAVTNLRPDLWKAVVVQVPFVDVINSMLDESLPLTVAEFEEWGNPKDREQYEVMIRYSPYDNIARKDYPAILVMTAYNDSQVMYWEPAKYVARLRALKTDKHPLLLRINMEPAGHDGHSGRYDRIHEEAFWTAFVLDQLGITR